MNQFSFVMLHLHEAHDMSKLILEHLMTAASIQFEPQEGATQGFLQAPGVYVNKLIGTISTL